MTVWSTRSGRNCSMRSAPGWANVGECVRDAEGRFRPGGVERRRIRTGGSMYP